MIFDEMHHDDGYHMMGWGMDLFAPYYWIFMILWWAIFFGIAIIMAYYVHKDARRRGIVNSEIWLIIVLIFNVVGLILYLVVRGTYENPE